MSITPLASLPSTVCHHHPRYAKYRSSFLWYRTSRNGGRLCRSIPAKGRPSAPLYRKRYRSVVQLRYTCATLHGNTVIVRTDFRDLTVGIINHIRSFGRPSLRKVPSSTYRRHKTRYNGQCKESLRLVRIILASLRNKSCAWIARAELANNVDVNNNLFIIFF